MNDLNNGKDIGWLLSEKYFGIETEAFKRDLEHLKQGTPLAYLIGHVPFLDATIYLDSHPLIPRTETEYWVEHAILEMRARGDRELNTLDLCAGSGCIGISVLKALPNTIVHFEEIDVRHHKTITKNLFENNIDVGRTKIFGGDVYSNLTDTYDFILANPPYINKNLERTDVAVIEHEPHNALFAEEQGLSIISKIINEAPEYLTEDGVLYIEHEPEQATPIGELADTVGLIAEPHKDQYGVLRFTRVCRLDSDLVSQ